MKRITNKTVLTVLSLASALIFFFGVCFFALWGLWRLDVFELPGETVAYRPPVEDDDMSLPVHTQVQEHFVSDLGTDVLDDLWGKVPFSDSYYVKVLVTSQENNYYLESESGTYEIWRFGDRFQINHYDTKGKIVKNITCDGEYVQIKNYSDITTSRQALSSENNFDKFSPILDFSDMKNRNYQVVSYHEENGIITVYYDYDEGFFFDKVEIDMKTGLIVNYIRRYYGDPRYQFTVENYDFDFVFEDYMFALN